MEKYVWDANQGTFLKTMDFAMLVANIVKVDQKSVTRQQVRVSMDVRMDGPEIAAIPPVTMNIAQNATISQISV
jgi:hypothetical protein